MNSGTPSSSSSSPRQLGRYRPPIVLRLGSRPVLVAAILAAVGGAILIAVGVPAVLAAGHITTALAIGLGSVLFVVGCCGAIAVWVVASAPRVLWATSARIQFESLLPDLDPIHRLTDIDDPPPTRPLVPALQEELTTLSREQFVSFGGLDGLISTQQVFATDIAQKVLDQYPCHPPGGPRITTDPRLGESRCTFWPTLPFAVAGGLTDGKDPAISHDLANVVWQDPIEPDALLDADLLGARIRSAFSRRPTRPLPDRMPHPSRGGGIGNPRETRGHDVWFRLPTRPTIDAVLDGGPHNGPHHYLHGHLCVHKYDSAPAPLAIVVPGMFDSVEQHYVRDTVSVLWEMGLSVLALDMRSHGDSRRFALRRGEDADYSFGWFEGLDILGVVAAMRTAAGPLVGPVHLVGYSGGGRNVVFAMQHLDRASDSGAAHRVGVIGALAICPLVEIPATLRTVAPPFGHFFNGLASRRSASLVQSLDPAEAPLNRLLDRALAGYSDVPEVVRAAVAPMWDRAVGGGVHSQRTVIVSAEDDPVVRNEQYASLESDPHFRARHVRARKGGHCAFVVFNQVRTRTMFWQWLRPDRVLPDAGP